MAAMAEPFSFPESKLTPPSPRRRVVDRPRLVQALRDGSARRLVVVTAEAGYGKTYLLVAALAAAGRPVAWLTLDESDTDPNLLAAGIRRHPAPRSPVPGRGAGSPDRGYRHRDRSEWLASWPCDVSRPEPTRRVGGHDPMPRRSARFALDDDHHVLAMPHVTARSPARRR
jgi:hypothetical protein